MSYIPAFPKPSQSKRVPKYLCEDGVFRFPNGREVCKLDSKKGMDEYIRRKRIMFDRQGGRGKCVCCLYGIIPECPGPLRWEDAMFEHEGGRGHGGGHRDDRVEIDGKPINGVAHPRCNSIKASRRISYNS